MGLRRSHCLTPTDVLPACTTMHEDIATDEKSWDQLDFSLRLEPRKWSTHQALTRID